MTAPPLPPEDVSGTEPVRRPPRGAAPRRHDTSWWLAALLVAGALLGWHAATDPQYRPIVDAVAQGIGVTVQVTLAGFALATLLGLVVAIAGRSRRRLLREAARLYCEVLRGIPVLVLLFYMAFVAAPGLVAAWNALTAWPQSRGWLTAAEPRDVSLLWRATLALAVSYSAFIAEVFRAGLQAVDGHQVDAARALGLGPWPTFRHVQGPLALRTVLPPLGNDFIAMVKDSALVSVLGVGDITQMAKVYASGSFEFFETYNVVAGVYLAMTVALSLGLRWLERRLRKGDPSR